MHLHPETLKAWREREMTFPPRVRRMTPDAIDFITGAVWTLRRAREAKDRK